MQSKLFLTKRELKYIDDMLNSENIDFNDEGIKEDEIIEAWTAQFEDGYEMDFKLCAGQTNCFIDIVLFNDKGSEVDCDSPDSMPDYCVLYDGDKEYRVDILIDKTKCCVCKCKGEIQYDDDGKAYCDECYEEHTMHCYECAVRQNIKRMKGNLCKSCHEIRSGE
jgi:hypothetical protein